MKISGILFAGKLPYFAAVMLCAACFYAGHEYAVTTIKPVSKIVYADKAAVVYGQLIKSQSISDESVDSQVRQPILDVLKKYQREGYVIIDSSKDEQGNMTLMALPKEARDITPELLAAVARASSGQAASKPTQQAGQ